jgi:hypothetical protein
MTTQTQSPFPSNAPSPARPKSRVPQLAAIVVGGALAFAGAGLALGGGALLAVFGGDGNVTSGSHALSTPTTALISSVADVDGTNDVSDVIGDPELRLSVRARHPGKGVFVGIGRADDVERYLASAAIEEVGDIEVDPFELTDRRLRSGSKRPAPPASQGFWVREGSGRDAATLRWKVRDGDYRLVVMNADASRKVDVDGSVGVKLAHLPDVAWVLLGAGLLLLAGGLAGGAVAGVRLARRDG